MFLVHLKVDFRVAQFSHDPEQPLDRHGRGARLFDIGLDPASDGHIQVDCCELQPLTIGTHEHIREDWQGGSGADHILHCLEAVDDLLLRYGQVHGALNM